MSPSAPLAILLPFHKVIKFLYFLVILSVIDFSMEMEMDPNYNPENYPANCFHTVETGHCIKICEDSKELVACYNQVDEKLSYEEKKRRWFECSFFNGGRNRCFDHCQANPENVNCKYSPANQCFSLKEPTLQFMTTCMNTNDTCIKDAIKLECERMINIAKEKHDGNRNLNKPGIDLDDLQGYWATYDTMLDSCMTTSYVKYQNCTNLVSSESPRRCFYNYLMNTSKNYCVHYKPKDWKGSAEEWEDKCNKQSFSKTICQALCPFKDSLQFCLNKCFKDKNLEDQCEQSKVEYEKCLLDSKCDGSDRLDCEAICQYNEMLRVCQSNCENLSVSKPNNCSAECSKRPSYDDDVRKCRKDKSHKFFNVPTPKECLNIICKGVNDTDLKQCISEKCSQAISQATVDEFCKNPQRVKIFKTCYSKHTPMYLKDMYNEEVMVEAFKMISTCEKEILKEFNRESCIKLGYTATICRVHCLTLHAKPITPDLPEEERRQIRDLSCPRVDPPKIFELTNFANCRWKIDFSGVKSPYKLWAHYYNELKATNVEEKLKRPDTTRYLDKTNIAEDGSEGYYVFPYFINIRDECEEGYQESFYRLIINGGYPLLSLQYSANSNRAKVRTAMKIKFRTSLVNLDGEDNLDNILPKRSQDELLKCHKGLCYPAFSAPMVLLHIPIFSVTVSADDVFEELSTSVYVSTFHSRIIPGQGKINFGRNDVLTNPFKYFPKVKLSRTGDKAIDEYESCVNQAETSCPPLYMDEYLPLSLDDLLSPSYTSGSAPVVVFAGFYTPNLLILGDADMKLFNYFEWEINSGSGKGLVFEEKTKCIFDGGRPMYSYLDLSDYEFPIKHYRIGYANLNYKNGTDSRGVFDVIAMEDRLLLVTLHGLVALYGNSFETQNSNKLWQSDEEDKLRECFKFVRSARTSMMTSDVVVGVTYGEETGNGREKVFMGKLVNSGSPLIWNEIASATDEYEDKTITEIEKICYKAKHQEMANVDGIITGFPRWCVALDATPVPAKESTIQVLVRMTIRREDDKLTLGGLLVPKKDSDIYYYIVASFTNYGDNSMTSLPKWTIDSMLPRIPCIVDHMESVQTIMAHGLQTSYFSGTDSEKNPGCTFHQNSGAKPYEGFLFLSHITYTRMLSNHMYLYGSSLVHSTDGGRSFSNVHAFPKVNDPKNPQRPQHIVVMAFDDAGHFSFLTNLRELWYGSTGELKPVRLRPSPGYSMTQTVVSNIPGLKDAIPFSVMFDSKNNLFEMVAVTREGEATHILKRPVLVSQIFQNNYFMTKMDEIGSKKEEMFKKDPLFLPTLGLKSDDNDERGGWELYCPFSSPQISENYSMSYKRIQTFFLRPPIQHPSMGEFFVYSSLVAYQAAAFGIVYKSLFHPQIEPYSRVGVDPITSWKNKKQTASQIGYLNWILGNTTDYGIYVDPADNIRELNEENNEMFYLSIDYGMVVTYELEFSIKNEASFALTSFAEQNIGQIQLNVDNANGSLLKINTERVRKEQTASVKFRVIMELNQASGLPQSLPGQNLFHIPVVFHFIGGFGRCFKTQEKPVDNSVSLLVLAGCLDSTTIMFDWNSTLRSIKFRDKKHEYGHLDECYNEEFACFFARQAVKLHFEIFDLARQVYLPFRGRYTMKVIAGGYSRDTMQKYSHEEQEAYNVPGVSDVSLIWTEWDEEANSKVKRKSDTKQDEKGNQVPMQHIVLKSGETTIKWACHTLSPCARISPTIFGETVYWFRMAISNRGVDNETLCLYEREFDILLYGIPPSPELQLLITILFCLVLLGILYALYYCCRSHKNVWRANKLKMVGWLQIAKDTIPRRLKGVSAASRAEDDALRRTRIIGSIQGHLELPDLSEKALQDLEKDEQVLMAKKKMEKGLEGDAESIRSTTSSVILPAVNSHTGAGTWTDLVYEQIITKRLQAMVQKNKQMREGILKKVDLSRMKESLEHEDRFLSTHGSKASSESAYQPPIFRNKRIKADRKSLSQKK